MMRANYKVLFGVLRQGSWFRMESSVALLNLATVATGFLLQIIVVRLAGIGSSADAYFATAAIPQVALSIAVHVASGALMPQLSQIERPDRIATAWAALRVISLFGLPVAVGLYLNAPHWVFLLFPGFAAGGAQESVPLAALAALAAPFAIMTAVLSSYLYAERRFITNEAVALGTTIALAVAAAILIPRFGIVALGWLVLLRFIVQLIALLAFLPFPGKDPAVSSLRAVWRKGRILLAGAVYFKSDLLVDRFLLSLAPAGALSLIIFGQSILVAASGVLGQSLANTATPALSAAHATGDSVEFRAILRRKMILIIAASTGLLFASVLLVPPITSLLTSLAITEQVVDLRWVLILLGGVPTGACTGALLANAHYAMGDARTPTLMTVFTFTIFLAAKFFVFIHYGLYAFCALTSVYYLLNAGLLAWLLRRKLRLEFAA